MHTGTNVPPTAVRPRSCWHCFFLHHWNWLVDRCLIGALFGSRPDLPMGILSLFLAAKSDTKLSTLTQICSAYSWLNVGGKLLKVLGLKRLFSEESEIKRKLLKLRGRWPAPLPSRRNRRHISVTACCCSFSCLCRGKLRCRCRCRWISSLMEFAAVFTSRRHEMALGLAAWQEPRCRSFRG